MTNTKVNNKYLEVMMDKEQRLNSPIGLPPLVDGTEESLEYLAGFKGLAEVKERKKARIDENYINDKRGE